MRGKLGESLGSIQKFNTPIEQATTSSLEALKAYSLGWKVRSEKGDAESIQFFKQAVAIDPNFAAAYANLGVIFNNLGETDQGIEFLKRAYDLRDRTSEREKLYITSHYYGEALGNQQKAIEAYQLWQKEYPNDPLPHEDAAVGYANLGQFEKAVADQRQSIDLDPDDVFAVDGLAGDFIALDRLDEAKATLNQGLARKLEDPPMHAELYYLAFLQNDAPQMAAQVSWLSGKPGVEDVIFSMQSDTEGYFGRLMKSRDYSRRASDSALRSGEKEAAANWQANAALREAEFGNFGPARDGAEKALALVPGRGVQILAAMTYARTGDAALASAIADKLDKQFPENTVLQNYWLPTIRAAIEIKRNNSAKAIELLRTTAPYELGGPVPVSSLYPAYVRGQAYLEARNGTDAAAEFLKLINHRGIVANLDIGALAHLQLGRAYALQGDSAKARAAYQDFFGIWKDADSDVPILREAKEEYAKLK